MEAFDTTPAFLLFAFQGCNGPGILGDTYAGWPLAAVVRPVTIPLGLLLAACASLLLGALLWWREVPKGTPLALIAISLLAVLGFFGYQGYDLYRTPLGFETFAGGGNYYIALGEFSFYLLIVVIMMLATLVLVWRETGWEAERNLLILTTGSTVVLTTCWFLFSLAVWNCVP